MKTNLEINIKTSKDAEAFITELCNNNEAYHPEDDALEIIFSDLPVEQQPTEKERKKLNDLMDKVYEVADFDPCELILTILSPEMTQEITE